MRSFIIAVDGPAASGKGTIAARLARAWGLPFLDTGLLYRTVGLSVLDSGGSLDDAAAAEAVARALKAENLQDVDRLTSGDAGEAASRVAGYPGVRAALLEFQRAFAAQPGGAVLDGRDIGTVIAPEAPAKLFVTATPEVRAMRRWKQLTSGATPSPMRTCWPISCAATSVTRAAARPRWCRPKTLSCWTRPIWI